jgi:hypothetical protein
MTIHTTRTVRLRFWFDESDRLNTGWAYQITDSVTGLDDDGLTVDVSHDETTGPVDVRRRDAKIDTVRRAFFRSIDPTSPTGRLRRAFARTSWRRSQTGAASYTATVKI